MSDYSYKWVGVDADELTNQLPTSTKVTVGPVPTPPLIKVTIDDLLMSPTDSAAAKDDLDNAMLAQNWIPA